MQEDTHTSTTGNRYRYGTMIVAAMALAILSSAGWLDNFAEESISDTTRESIGIFVLSRGVNAGISMLQSSEVGIGIASMQIGELLDPINDAAERLSSVMVWAIGSLLLQRFALELTSATLFKWGFVAIAAMLLAALLIVEYRQSRNKPNASLERCRSVLIQVFVLAAMLRFIVPAFVAIGLLISQQFLQPRIEEERAGLAELRERIPMVEQEIVDLATNAKKALDDRNAQEPERDEQGIFSNPLGGLNRLLSTVTDVIERMLPDVNMPGLSQITDLRDRAVEFVQRLTELLVLVAIKNIVLPLVFLAIAVKGTLPIVKWLIRMSETNCREH
jgi:cell division protein FtsB